MKVKINADSLSWCKTVICTKQQFHSNKMETTVKWLSDWSFWSFQHAINCIQAINFQSGAQQGHMLPTPMFIKCTKCKSYFVYETTQKMGTIGLWSVMPSSECFICWNPKIIFHFIKRNKCKDKLNSQLNADATKSICAGIFVIQLVLCLWSINFYIIGSYLCANGFAFR